MRKTIAEKTIKVHHLSGSCRSCVEAGVINGDMLLMAEPCLHNLKEKTGTFKAVAIKLQEKFDD